MKKTKEKVFVGISGGVDSSVAAYLLKKEGYDVHGIFVKTWAPEWLPCTWVDEKRDAMRICATLDIPFHYLDAETAYRDEVAQYMIDEYKKGRTPNPDVLCNRVIKFGTMWEYAKNQGATYIATGHYAQTDGAFLYKGADSAKDQSYFLWMLEKEDLAHTLFPIGHLQKKEVRALAERAGLFTHQKKDSQGICFLGDVDMRSFLSHYIEQKKGAVVTEEGEVIGEHDGIWFYTLGERHGFRITKKESEEKRYYVVKKDIETNTLVVAHTAQKVLTTATQSLTLARTYWAEDLSSTEDLTAQIRYHGALIPLSIQSKNTVQLSYDGLIATGQSLVCYQGEKVIGGGIIDSVV